MMGGWTKVSMAKKSGWLMRKANGQLMTFGRVCFETRAGDDVCD
jgi:hypothetical protein